MLPELLPRNARLPFDFSGSKLLIVAFGTLELLEFTKTRFASTFDIADAP